MFPPIRSMCFARLELSAFHRFVQGGRLLHHLLSLGIRPGIRILRERPVVVAVQDDDGLVIQFSTWVFRTTSVSIRLARGLISYGKSFRPVARLNRRAAQRPTETITDITFST